MKIEEAIATDPDILGGALCFRGTRVPVKNLFDYLEGGHSVEYFLEAFDWISREQVLAVLDQSVSLLEQNSAKALGA